MNPRPDAISEAYRGSKRHSTAVTKDGREFAVCYGRCVRPGGVKTMVRFVAQVIGENESGTQIARLFCDRAGNYYAHSLSWAHGQEAKDGPDVLRKLDGPTALAWFAEACIADAHLREEARRAFESPEFVFMPALTRNEARKQKRARKKSAPARAEIAEQLQLATGLVAVLRRMETAPTCAALSEACRLASRLHTRLHAPETFKRVSAA
jgi:hypothetical protein